MYTTNEQLPALRAQAVKMIRDGKSTRAVAKYFGYSQGAIVKWCKKLKGKDEIKDIPTLSSRPKRSRTISNDIKNAIIAKRIQSKRCAEIVHSYLIDENIQTSLSTVKRVIKRYGLVKKRSPWKKVRKYPPRPDVLRPGDLIEFDTVHVYENGIKVYIYTAIDIYTRYAFAYIYKSANNLNSCRFLNQVMRYFDFNIKVVQTDNGPEFSKCFTDYTSRKNIKHRHIHVRSPNENGHLERFNRTIQEEPWQQGLSFFRNESLHTFLEYYNTERKHLGIECKTPKQKLREVNTRC